MKFVLERSQPQLIDQSWCHHWISSNGEPVLSYRRQDSDHWLRFRGLADFRISTITQEISCFPVGGTTEETIRHLLLDQVLPRCLAHQERVMLHASAVKLGQGLLLFIGDSGTGKSTLASNFHRADNPAISDDCVWIKESLDNIGVVPTYSGLRLWEDSLQVLFSTEINTSSVAHYSSKKRVALREDIVIRSTDGIPIVAMIVLAPSEQRSASQITLERLSNREAFIAILKQTFQLDILDVDRMTNHIQTLGRIVPRLKVFRLSLPHDYALLPLVRQKILETVL